MKHNAFWYGKNHLSVIIALIFFGLAACEQESDCSTDSTNIAAVEFLKLVNDEGSNNENDNVDEILVYREGSDLRYNIEPFGLPLDPASNSTTFYVFREINNSSTVDTIVLNYQREQTLISPDCGPDQRFIGITVDTSRTTFDSVFVRSDEVTEFPDVPNIRIYTCRYEMTNTIQLNLDFAQIDDEVTDTLIIRRIYSSIGKEDVLQNDTIPENNDVTVSVPVDPNQTEIQVFVEFEQDTQPVRQINLLYRRDNFQVTSCLPQDRYRIDSVWVGDTIRLYDPEITNEVLNLNNSSNAKVSIR